MRRSQLSQITPPAKRDSYRIAILTLDNIGQKMAGPAIRAWEMASLLSQRHQVKLLTFGQCERTAEHFEVRKCAIREFRRLADDIDIVILQGFLLHTFQWLHQSNHYLVVDWYDPFHLESLEVERYKPLPERNMALATGIQELQHQAARADLFLCASGKQRDFWLGYLAGQSRLNPLTYDSDKRLEKLLVQAPFGIDPQVPQVTDGAIKGVVPGIGKDDPVVIWGGGVYNWFDPLTCIRAVDLARAKIPNLRLFFMGMQHPNPDVPQTKMAAKARKLADDLGLSGKHVFFNEQWVEYSSRQNYLCDADIGISAHCNHVETEFSFRTRILDYLWAGLPIVCSEGDVFGDLVQSRGLGRAVPVEDPAAMAEALVTILQSDRQELTARVRQTAQEYYWPRALAPVVDYCNNPYKSGDWKTIGPFRKKSQAHPLDWVKRMWGALGDEIAYGGLLAAAKKISNYLGRRVLGPLIR